MMPPDDSGWNSSVCSLYSSSEVFVRISLKWVGRGLWYGSECLPIMSKSLGSVPSSAEITYMQQNVGKGTVALVSGSSLSPKVVRLPWRQLYNTKYSCL